MRTIPISAERLNEMAEEGRQIIKDIRAKGPDPNSALIWFPPIRDAGLRVPKTEFVEFDHESLWPILDGEGIRDDFPMEKLKEACKRIGYPVFIRTDLSSAKHDGPISFRAESDDDLWRCVCRTFEDNACKDLASFVRAWMVREWIDIQSSFTAFGGLAIGREWRFFADQDKVICHHFYWPKDAFEGWGIEDGWQDKLRELSTPLPPEFLDPLESWALKAVRSIGHDAWSIDFALDKGGTFWLIDMARAESSWHPKHEEVTV